MAEQKLLQLTIAKVDKPLFSGAVQSVTVPGVAGEMTILAEHAALISPLQAGLIVVRTSAGEETFEIEGGILEISHNQATILV